jgi:hypothetical protein
LLAGKRETSYAPFNLAQIKPGKMNMSSIVQGFDVCDMKGMKIEDLDGHNRASVKAKPWTFLEETGRVCRFYEEY